MEEDKQKIAKALLDVGAELEKESIPLDTPYTHSIEADKLIDTNPLAFLFGVIFDQGVKAEKAWGAPYFLKERLGHLDVYKIATIPDEELSTIFNRQPKLHRFPNVAALRIKKACKLIVQKYGGNVENLWNDNPRSDDLQRRFEEFEGIGQKKASMATNILVRDFEIKVHDRRGIDISYDIHVRRVFLRTGLVDKDDRDAMIELARELNPEYPGGLDYPAWHIGRNWCRPTNPDCENCPLSQVCPKKHRDEKILIQ